MTVRGLWGRWLAVAAVVLIAAACSKSTVHLVDACTLLAPDDLQLALGSDPGTPKAGKPLKNHTVCTFSAGPIVGLSPSSRFDPTVKTIRKGSAEVSDVPGLGDKAVFAVTSGAVGQLVAAKGKYTVDITSTLANHDKAKSLDALKALAEKAFAKLPSS